MDAELIELQKQFEAVDRSDPKSLLKWFADTSYLNMGDQAIIMNLSTDSVRIIKRSLGLKGWTPPKVHKFAVQRQIQPDIIVPENWDTKEWLEEQHKKYSLKQIGRMVGRHRLTIRTKFIKYGIKKRTIKEATKNKNPCCTKEWCYKHYIKQRLSTYKCAKLCGISSTTFATWLARFGIKIRDAHEKQSTLWAKKLIKNIRKYANKIRYYGTSMLVQYTLDHGQKASERYWLVDDIEPHVRALKLDKNSGQFTRLPRISYEFENDLNQEQHLAHFIMNKKDYKKATTIEKRVAIHQLVRKFTYNYIEPNYPKHIIDRDLADLKQYDLTLKGNIIETFSRTCHPRPGIKIIEHFFGLDEIKDYYTSPGIFRRAIKNVANKPCAINSHNIWKMLRRMPEFRPMWRTIYSPIAWMMIFQKFEVKSILDLAPNYGSKAIACALLGIKYVAIPTPRLEKALAKGLAEFIPLQYEPYSNQFTDLVILDNNFRTADMTQLLPYAHTAKRMILSVGDADKRQYEIVYKPTSILKVQKGFAHKKRPHIDNLFIF